MRGMKVKDATILIVPGYTGSGPDHWQSRWAGKLSTARVVEQADWDNPVLEDWTERLAHAVNGSERPVVLIAHSLGVATVVRGIPQFRAPVAGAFLVSPPDLELEGNLPANLMAFGPYPRDPLPFPSVVAASSNDPYCALDVAEDIANAWGSALVHAGEAGHINVESGYGPWPEGSMAFANFLTRLPG